MGMLKSSHLWHGWPFWQILEFFFTRLGNEHSVTHTTRNTGLYTNFFFYNQFMLNAENK